MKNKLNIKPFTVKDKLQKDLFPDGEHIDSRIRLKLLEIADDFVETLEVKWLKPIDMIVTGSLVNYNWNEYSDIDIHIIYDYSKIYKNVDFVQDYFMSKRKEWNNLHNNLKIKGFPVELSVEDVNNPLNSTGVYSLYTNDWVKKPKKMSNDNIDIKKIKKLTLKIVKTFIKLFDLIENETDIKKLDILSEKLNNFIDILHENREKGLKTEKKELSTGNIIWKIVKHFGYVEKSHNILNNIYDKKNTIKEQLL
jgi:hypothetical protein